jgi:hypothetical protein
MSEMAIEREGVMDMMTNKELARELVNRLEAEFPTIENDEDAYGAHILIGEINEYIKRSE